MAGKDFFDVPKTIANTSEGELELPVLIFRCIRTAVKFLGGL